jgi:hypothetical protein
VAAFDDSGSQFKLSRSNRGDITVVAGANNDDVKSASNSATVTEPSALLLF